MDIPEYLYIFSIYDDQDKRLGAYTTNAAPPHIRETLDLHYLKTPNRYYIVSAVEHFPNNVYLYPYADVPSSTITYIKIRVKPDLERR